MFKKKAATKPFASLKGSERKKFMSTILQRFGIDESHFPAEAKSRLAPKELKNAKIQLHSGERAVLYTDGSRPLFVLLSDNQIVPTVYTLWENPYLLPIVCTPEYTIGRLQNGADLMIPGIFPPYPDLQGQPVPSGYPVAIASTKRPNVPVAVGITALDFGNIDFENDRGKAVLVCNVIGDTLFESYRTKVTIPEDLDRTLPVEKGVDSVGEVPTTQLADMTIKGGSKSDADKEKEEKVDTDIQYRETDAVEQGDQSNETDQAPSQPPRNDLPTEQIDNAFIMALYQTLKKAVDNPIELPISSTLLLSQYLLTNLPYTDPSVQMKKTSWKRASKFFKTMEKGGLLKTKERNGELIITSLTGKEVDKIKNFQLFKPKSYTAPAAGSSTQVSTPSKKDTLLNAKEYWRPQYASIPLFEAMGASTIQFYALDQLKQVLVDYIKKQDLINKENPKLINIDDVLAKALSTGAGTTLGRDKLAWSLQKNCSIFHVINQPGESGGKVVRGPIPQIKLYVERRTRGKLATRVVNLEAFHLDPVTIAEELRVLCAGSTTVNPVKEGSDLKEVMVQGSQSRAVVKLLETKGVRSNWIEINEKAR